MGEDKKLIRKEKLNNLIAAYADMWADVLLDKNLDCHFKGINEDLKYLKHLIALRDVHSHDTTTYCKISNQLICLRAIIEGKLKKHEVNKHNN